MAMVTDYASTSRFASDKDFKIVTRKGQVIAGPVLLPTPIRGGGDRLLVVTVRQEYRWDLIAHELLGDVNLRWVLMRHNRIDDPFAGPRAGDRLLIPTTSQVAYYLGQ